MIRYLPCALPDQINHLYLIEPFNQPLLTSTILVIRKVQQFQLVFCINQPMREAKRLFAKNKTGEMESSPSSIFRSKIPRDLPNDSKRNSIGPGQYNIAFPLVKPKFEAIRKNNNTIIIKVNEKLSPVFQSLQPRFKSVRPQRSMDMEEAAEVYALISTSTREGSQKNEKIEHGMMNRIKKLNEVLRMDEGGSKLLGEGRDKMTVEKLESIQGNEEVVNSLKLYKKERERLHFLLKSIRTRNESKGFEWSKYRQTKGNLYSINNVPGPGSYNEHHLAINPRVNRYLDTIEDKSWQFKSLTKRSSFALNEQERNYELYPRQKQSDIDGKFYKVDSIPLIKDRSVSHIDADLQQL